MIIGSYKTMLVFLHLPQRAKCWGFKVHQDDLKYPEVLSINNTYSDLRTLQALNTTYVSDWSIVLNDCCNTTI